MQLWYAYLNGRLSRITFASYASFAVSNVFSKTIFDNFVYYINHEADRLIDYKGYEARKCSQKLTGANDNKLIRRRKIINCFIIIYVTENNIDLCLSLERKTRSQNLIRLIETSIEN